MKYLLTFDVIDVHGAQTYSVDANNEAEALEMHKKGLSSFVAEDVEVLRLADTPDVEVSDEP